MLRAKNGLFLPTAYGDFISYFRPAGPAPSTPAQHLNVARDVRRRRFLTDLFGNNFCLGLGVLIVATIQTGRVHQPRTIGKVEIVFRHSVASEIRNANSKFAFQMAAGTNPFWLT
jgi:hypothetical protein